MRHIAVIPARGGSKRLPRKNIIDFMGKPMIAWTIEAALESELFDRVLVSTDSSEIAEVAKSHGATVPFLRDDAHDDHTPVSRATCVALYQCAEELGESYDLVTQLMANTPLRTAKDIRESVNNFLQGNAPAQISCFPFGWMNPWWAASIDESGHPSFVFPEARRKRSQDLPKLYCPSGAIWIAKYETLLKSETFYCTGYVFFPLSWQSAIDIDDAEDLSMAEMTFIMREKAA
jgi:N-acylneuraminate cytidylyltransferase